MQNIYVTSDTHGNFETLKQGINELLTPGDRLVFLGDAIDRGPNGYELIKYLLDFNKDFQVTMLMGNHESMLLEFIDEVFNLAKLKGQIISTIEQFFTLTDELSPNSIWAQINGGDSTLSDMRKSIHSLKELQQFYTSLSKLPYHVTVECNDKTFYLVHGSPAKDNECMIWDPTLPDKDYSEYGDYVVFGHTITWHYYHEEPGKNKLRVFYGKNNVIGIDTGASVPLEGGRVSFLRLNDLKAFYYEIDIQ